MKDNMRLAKRVPKQAAKALPRLEVMKKSGTMNGIKGGAVFIAASLLFLPKA
jgi:hypothetical protein